MFSVFRNVGVVIAILVAFLFGFATTVYLSLRSSEVTVPVVVGKDRFVAENELQAAGLNFRIRAARPSKQVKPDTVMFQLPRAGEVVKTGQTVAVDVARVPREGEAAETVTTSDNSNANANANDNSNSNDNQNTNQAANANGNDNKPKRNRNSNVNGNANSNANNGNGNRNSNRPNANGQSPG